MKLILVGRSGSGKTSILESITGSTLSTSDPTQTVSKFGSSVKIAETLGFFSQRHDENTCTMELAESVYSFSPGPDAFGLVIRIGRFTAEEKKMIDIFQNTFGEEVFRFTILIFTRLDDLLYDNVSLDDFLQDCTPDMKNLLTLCGGRYVGFDNTGNWESRSVYAQTLVSMMKTLQMKNNTVYTVDMLEQAKITQMKKKEEEQKVKEESHRHIKERMKFSLRQELQEQIKKDVEQKLEKEELDHKRMVQNIQPNRVETKEKYGDKMKLILVGRSGSGKTSILESIIGSTLSTSDPTQTVSKFGSSVKIAETLGFFSQRHDENTCTMKLAESVYSFSPGPDAFGLVIRIGRFTAEEKKMIDIFQDTFGEEVFRFTILIFTRLDDLLYDSVSLDDFLQDCTQDMEDLLSLCGGRYVGFDNTGTWEARSVSAQTLVSMMKTLQLKNNTVYTVDMLEQAKITQMKKKEEEQKVKEESHRHIKEQIKSSLRQELEEQIKKDVEQKLEKEELDHKRMFQSLRPNRIETKEKWKQLSLPTPRVSDEKPEKQVVCTKQKNQGGTRKEEPEQITDSPKKETKKPKGPGRKPALKPKPSSRRKKNDSAYVGDMTSQGAAGVASRPTRSGFIGRLISFWESWKRSK